MALRFRRTVPLGRYLRLNFSKSGTSLSVGGKGLRVNFGKRGTRTTVGIPGTGISYSEQQRYSDGSPSRAGTGGAFGLIVVAVGVIVVLSMLFS